MEQPASYVESWSLANSPAAAATPAQEEEKRVLPQSDT